MSPGPRVLALMLAIGVVAPMVRAQQIEASGTAESATVQARVQRALTLIAAGSEQEAEAILEEVVSEVPTHGTARLQLGRLALERGDLAAARQHLEIAVASDPQRLYLAWFLLGRVALAQRDGERSLVAFEQALRAAPRFAPARIGRVEALIALGRPEEALDQLFEGSSSADDETRLLAAQLMVFLERPEEARTLLEPLAGGSDAGKPVGVVAQALLLALDDAPEAGSALDVLVGRNLSRAGVYLAVAVRRQRLEMDEQAVSALEIGRAIDETSSILSLYLERLIGAPSPEGVADPTVRGRFARASALYREGRLDEAAALARAIVEAHPRHLPARLIVLEDEARAGDLWSALAGYRLLLRWMPGLPALESQLADVAHAMGAESLARCAVEEGLAAFPDEGALHYRLGTILAAQGESEAAIAALERAIEEGFTEPEVWLTLGSQRLERMRVPQAIEAYREALRIDPATAEAIGSFALQALSESRDQEIRQLLERRAAARPDDAETRYALGLAALRDGELEVAVSHLEAAAGQLSDRPQVHYNLALAYRRLERRQEAQSEMQRFRDLEARDNERWEEHNRWHRVRLSAEEALAADRPRQALELYRQLMASGGATLDDSIGAGRAALAAGDPRTASQLFESVLGAKPYSAAALEGAGEALRALGDADGAKASAERLALLAPSCG